MLRVAVVTLLILVAQPAKAAQLPDYIVKAKRIVFLGDSVTHDGRFISFIEYQLRQLRLKRVPELINLGLPSETCSGLSEPDHPFPRPNVHERLDRALTKLKPDVVVACYGMNDGIYYPFIPSHFTDFKLGVQNLIKKVHKSGAKLVLMTPPAFDPLPMKKKGKLRKIDAPKFAWFGIYEKYDDVMARYAKWVLTLKKKVVGVIDMHTPMNDYLKEKRKTNPDFVLSGDGVHINYEGHLVFAGAILKAWGLKPTRRFKKQSLALIMKRQKLLHDAWLSEVGHKRPGVKPGLPIKQAVTNAAALETQIRSLIAQGN